VNLLKQSGSLLTIQDLKAAKNLKAGPAIESGKGITE